MVVPLRPPTIKLTAAQLDSLAGEYREPNGHGIETIFRQGDQLFEKSPGGEVVGLEAESADTFFRPGESSVAHNFHLTFERDAKGRVTGYLCRDNRHEERWVKVRRSGVMQLLAAARTADGGRACAHRIRNIRPAYCVS